MRHVARICNTGNTPAKLALPATIIAWETIANTGDTELISEAIYRDPYNGDDGEGKNSRVVDALNTWYLYKCAYCERIYKLDVDHYRPKGEVKDENNNVIRVQGYYWLCYEWSNLIPACITCNREGGKGSKFPFRPGGVQVVNPAFNADGKLNKSLCEITNASLLGELPVLLNPEIDNNFENYFSFTAEADLHGIEIVGTDADRRGEITINLCNLNRKETRRDRLQNVVRPFVNSVSALVKLKEAGVRTDAQFKMEIESLLQKLYNDRQDVTLNHTLLRKYIVASHDNFINVVIPFLPAEQRAFIREAFINYTPV